MKKFKIRIFYMCIISLLLIFSSIKVTQASIVWEYEENLNDFKEGTCYSGYEGYNSFFLTNTKTINMISFYAWNNPSNITHPIFIKLGIYSNYDNSPETLLSQSEVTAVNKEGWINTELTITIFLTSLTYYWIGWITNNCSEILWQYYRNVTNEVLFTNYQSERIWDNLFNPAEIEGNVTNTRFFAFKLGLLYTDDTEISTDFIDIFRNPENYFAGIMVIAMTIILIYFILQRRK